MSWGYVGAAAVTAVSSTVSANKAADASAAGAEQAAALQQGAQATMRNDLSPYMGTGNLANNRLNEFLRGDMSNFTNSPGYQFRLNEGLKTLQNSAAGNQMLKSGTTDKAIIRYGQDYASNEYGNEWNRLKDLSGAGQNAAAGVGTAGATAATNMGNAYQNAADSRGSAYLAQGEIFGGLGRGIGNGLASRPRQPGTSTNDWLKVDREVDALTNNKDLY